MRKMLLGLAGIAALVIAAPAAADSNGNRNFGHGPGSFDGLASASSGGQQGGRNRHDGGGGDGGVWVNGGEWARYNNRPFEADSFNGWWHDRPDRAYPAWMRNNQDCAKPWYQGSTLRC